MGQVPTWVTIAIAIVTGLGVRELLAYYVKRRDDRTDSAQTEERARAKEVSVVEAGANAAILQTLLIEMRARIDSYEGSIREMRDTHVRDMADVKAENRQLDRQVQDLRSALRDWQLGNQVPRGQVLLPLREVRRIREHSPGLLDSPWYPGEADAHTTTPGDPSIVARITPMADPGPGPVQ